MQKLLGALRQVRAGGPTHFTRYTEQIVDGCKLRVVCTVEPLRPPRRVKQPARAAPGFKKVPVLKYNAHDERRDG